MTPLNPNSSTKSIESIDEKSCTSYEEEFRSHTPLPSLPFPSLSPS